MAAARSTLLDGLEDISEDEQLRRVLELSRGDAGPGRSLINKQTLELHYLVLQRGISARAWKAISNTLAFPPGMEAYK